MTRRQQKEQYTSHLEKLTNSPKLAEAFYAEGMAYRYVLHKREEAIASFTRAIQLNLDTADVFYQRGLVFAEELKIAEAIEDFTRAIQFNHRDPDYYYSRGTAFFDAADYRKAIADLTEAIRLSSEIANVQFRRGRAYYALGDKQNAIADFTAALKSNPHWTESYYWRGLAVEDTGDKQRAIADYIKVAQNNPLENDGKQVDTGPERSDAEIHIYRGVARLALANGEEPEEFYGSPAHLKARKELEAYHAQAIEDFSLVIQTNPNLPEAYYWRARAQRWRGAGGQTIADLNKAILLKPDFVYAYLERARNRGDLQAIKDLNEVVRLRPHWAVVYYERGRHFSYRTPTRDTTRSAFADLTRAIEINPAFSEAYMERGLLRSGRVNDVRGAIRDFTHALRLTPDAVHIYRARANLRLEIKNYRGAVEDLDRTIELASGATLTTRTGLASIYESRSLARYELGDGLGSYEDHRRAQQLFVYCPTCALSSDLAKAKKADSFFQKGLSLSLRGDNRGAKWNFGEAARLYRVAGNMSKYQNAKYQLSKL
jgi:tetratricopeptide (TPR) repeat protein